MSTQSQARKIAFIGASGQVGKPTVDALLASETAHIITALQRPEAKSTFPAGVIVKKGDLEDEAFLSEVLRGQDALVLMPPLSHLVELQKPAIRVAAKVGIPYIFPSEFGPDPFATQLIKDNGLLQAKKGIRDLIEELKVSSWISIAVGPWLDDGLRKGLWGIDANTRKATIYNGANVKVSTASIPHTAEALAAVLSLPEAEIAKYKNGAMYTPSFHLSQRELLKAVQQASGTTDADWNIDVREVADVQQEYEAKMKAGDGMAGYTKFFVTHYLDAGANFESKTKAAELQRLAQLGLGTESLEAVIKTTM